MVSGPGWGGDADFLGLEWHWRRRRPWERRRAAQRSDRGGRITGKSKAVMEGLKRKGYGERRSPPKAKLPRPES